MLNKIVIMGRLTADPTVRKTSSEKSVANFTVAVDRDFGAEEKETDFIDCVAWGGAADFIGDYFFKGSMAVVSGRLQIRRWEDKDGNPRRSAEISVENIYFGEPKREEKPVEKPAAKSRYRR